MPQEPAAAPTEFAEAAGQAKLTSQIRGFLSWLGTGRKLTQTGRIGLVDARHLVELLDTGDTIDPKIGDRVFKTKSSEELRQLTVIVEWAKAARLVRVTGSKLVPVQKNAKLADEPLNLVLALLAAYPKLGKALFPGGHWRQSLVGDEFSDIGAALLTALLRGPGPCPLADLSDLAYEMIQARYMLHRLTDSQLGHLRGMIEVDVMLAMSALNLLGVAILDRNSDEVNEYGSADWSKATAELTGLGRYAHARIRGGAQPGDPVLGVRITLAGADNPSVWREVIIPASYTLDRVHAVVQAAMGWQESHLHVFRIAGRDYGIADPDGELGHLDERKFRLGDLVQPADVIEYEYDFGDGWEHELAVEASAPADAARVYPECTGGEGACPPEDCGGLPGFAELKALLDGPPSPERDEMRVWAGEDYDPARFDLAAANAAAGSV